MRAEIGVICDLIGNLIEVGGPGVVDQFKSKPKGDLQRKIMSYSQRPFQVVWTYANEDLIALIAISDLMYEHRIQPLARLNEEEMQLRFGVNALSAPAMKQAISEMQKEKKRMVELKLQCDAIVIMAKTLVATSWISDFFSSQPHFDELARQELNKHCDSNRRSIDKVLGVLNTVLPINEKVLRAYVERRSFPQ